MRSFRFQAPATVAVALLLVGFVAASAPDVRADGHEGGEPDPRIAYRQKVMSTIGTNMGALSDILKHQLEVPGGVANHAGQMATAAALIAPAFRPEVHAGPTDAKPDIWAKWAKFERAIADYEEAARGLEAAAKSGDGAAVGKAVKALGKSCGGCHKPFRKPKEESYKNR